MLQGVVNYGTGKAIRDMGVTAPVAGKTGTTNNGDGRLVRRLHADARRRHLVRLRHAATDQHECVRRPTRRAGVGGVLSGGMARATRLGVRRAGRHGVGGGRSAERRVRDASGVRRGRGSGSSQGASRRSPVICTRARRRDRSRWMHRRRRKDGLIRSRQSDEASATSCGGSFTGSDRPLMADGLTD